VHSLAYGQQVALFANLGSIFIVRRDRKRFEVGEVTILMQYCIDILRQIKERNELWIISRRPSLHTSVRSASNITTNGLKISSKIQSGGMFLLPTVSCISGYRESDMW
jgi:hypothetical protein